MIYQANKRQLHGSVRCAGRAVLGANRRPCMGRELEGHEIGVF